MEKKLVRDVLDLDVMGKQDSDTSCKEVNIDHEKVLHTAGAVKAF